MKRIGMAVVLACVASSATVSADDKAKPQPPPPSKPPPPVQVTLEGKQALTASSLAPGAVAEKIAGPYAAAIRRCYGDQLARSPGAKGKLVLGFQVTARGETAALRATSFDARLDACVAGQAAAWKFPVPKGPDGTPVAASFELSFQLQPAPALTLDEQAAAFADMLTSGPGSGADGDLASRRTPGADLGRQIEAVRERGTSIGSRGGGGSAARGGGGGAGTGAGTVAIGGGTGGKIDPQPPVRIAIASTRALGTSSLDVAVVAAKISAAYMAGLKRCYRERLKVDPKARGKLALALEVNETGRAVRPTARGIDASVETCVQQQVASWRFPIPKDGEGEPTDASFQLELALSPD